MLLFLPPLKIEVTGKEVDGVVLGLWLCGGVVAAFLRSSPVENLRR
jgi:hypothetical protein